MSLHVPSFCGLVPDGRKTLFLSFGNILQQPSPTYSPIYLASGNSWTTSAFIMEESPTDDKESSAEKNSPVGSWDFSGRDSSGGRGLSFTEPRTLSEYAVNINPALLPEDEWKIEPKDEKLEFFQKVSF